MIKQCWSQKCLNPTKKQILVDNGTFILPVMWFSYSKLSSEIKIDLFIFRGSPKQYWSQNFVYLTQKTKICYIMIPLFYLVNMASLCNGVGSDLTAPFKLPGWKKLWKFEKIAWKTKKWYPKTSTVILSGMQCHLMSFYEIS